MRDHKDLIGKFYLNTGGVIGIILHVDRRSIKYLVNSVFEKSTKLPLEDKDYDSLFESVKRFEETKGQ